LDGSVAAIALTSDLPPSAAQPWWREHRPGLVVLAGRPTAATCSWPVAVFARTILGNIGLSGVRKNNN